MACVKPTSTPTYRAQVARGFIFSTVGTNLRSQVAKDLSIADAQTLFNALALKGQQSFLDTPQFLGKFGINRVKTDGFRGEFVRPIYTTQERAQNEVYLANQDKHLLYLHGGAFFSGNPSTHRIIPVGILRNIPINILSCDYAKVTENGFSSALQNVTEAYNYLVKVKKVPEEKIVIVGDSSGANLAISLSLQLQKEQRKQPAAIVSITPWLDLSLSGESYESNVGVDPLFGGSLPLLRAVSSNYSADTKNPLVSPIFASTEQLRNLPTTLLISAEDDVFYSDSVTFEKVVKEASNDAISMISYPNMFHSWMLFNTPETFSASKLISDFILQRLQFNIPKSTN